MKPSILLLIILLMCFGWINATEPEEYEEPEDGVSVQLPPYPGKVIMCKLQLKYDSEFHDKDYYYNASSVTPFRSDYLKYTGGKDNSCSFNYGPYKFMVIPWRVVGLYKVNSRWDCIFNYKSDLEACERIDSY